MTDDLPLDSLADYVELDPRRPVLAAALWDQLRQTRADLGAAAVPGWEDLVSVQRWPVLDRAAAVLVTLDQVDPMRRTRLPPKASPGSAWTAAQFGYPPPPSGRPRHPDDAAAAGQSSATIGYPPPSGRPRHPDDAAAAGQWSATVTPLPRHRRRWWRRG